MGGNRWPIALAIVTAVSLATAGIVVASIPDSNGVIHGCYKKNGQLRVIDTAQGTCGSSETALSWNQRGPAGPPGAAGASPQVIGGSGRIALPGQDGRFDTYFGLFGHHSDEVRGWSPLPVEGAVDDLIVTLAVPPGSPFPEDDPTDASVTFTVMCRHPGGPASSCDGQGPGPVATPLSCTIRHADYANLPDKDKIVPTCSDTSPDPFEFGAGDGIALRAREFGDTSPNNQVYWTVSFTPAP